MGASLAARSLKWAAWALCFVLSVSVAFAHVGPGAHQNLTYAAPPGPQKIAPGAYYAVEYYGEPGMEFITGVVKARGEVDILWMNSSQFEAYKRAVAAGGGPLSYDHRRSPLALNLRWDDYWQVPEPGRYALVVDNTPLPVGGGRGREEAEVYVALGSDRPPPSPAPAPQAALPAWVWQAAALAAVAGLLGWRAARRRRAPPPRRGRGVRKS